MSAKQTEPFTRPILKSQSTSNTDKCYTICFIALTILKSSSSQIICEKIKIAFGGNLINVDSTLVLIFTASLFILS